MASQQRGELGSDAGDGALVDPQAEELEDTEGEPMEVFLRRQDGSHIPLSASSTDTVGTLKLRVCTLGFVAVRATCMSVRSYDGWRCQNFLLR